MAISAKVDDEWQKFILSGYDQDTSSDDEINNVLNEQSQEIISANLSLASRTNLTFVSARSRLSILNSLISLANA